MNYDEKWFFVFVDIGVIVDKNEDIEFTAHEVFLE